MSKYKLTNILAGAILISGIAIGATATNNSAHINIKKTKDSNVLLLSNHNNNTSNQGNLLNIVQYKSNRVNAFSEATCLHGSIMDNCTYYVSSLLRMDGYNIPGPTGSVSELKQWAHNQSWNFSSNLSELKPGDICFAYDNDHTFVFVSWYNKSKGLANVNDNQLAYFDPQKATYVRDLNGSKGGMYLPGCGNDNSYLGVQSFATPKRNEDLATVKTGGISLHLRNGVDGKLIGSIPNSSKVNILSRKDGWYKVNYQGHIGWVAGWYLAK
ncbi:MAG: SH3 domain-containing protein [Sarcina sp.]